jgi:hypothetical protein
MTAPTTDVSTANPHREIEELLPWYANGTLTPAEQAMVEQHLKQCPACRMKLEPCRVLVTQLHEPAEAAWRLPASHFDRLMADINRLASPPTRAKTGPTLLQRILDGLRATPSPVRWTLVFESLTVAVLALVLLLPATPPTEPGYETLSDGEAPMTTMAPRLQVVFAEPMTIGELHTLLRDMGGQIVAGPTALGVYTVAVTGGERPAEAQTRALTTLRANEHVRLVEPLEPR